MIIAQQKRKENIVEYIMYMRQIQVIIRINKFNIGSIEETIINNFSVDSQTKTEMRNWYVSLIETMKANGLEASGDLPEVLEIIKQLNELHNSLLSDEEEFRHKELYRWAKPNIDEYRKKSNTSNKNDVELCIDALNSLMLLGLKNEPISDDTAEAMQTFSNLLASLAANYTS